jgi:hypothetical protein
MATTVTISPTAYDREAPYMVATWSALTTNDNGDPVTSAAWTDRSVQVDGTFATATVVLQGSNDGTNWFTLTDPLGNNISFTAAGLKQVLQAAVYMRPSVTSGTSPSINVRLLMTRQSR